MVSDTTDSTPGKYVVADHGAAMTDQVPEQTEYSDAEEAVDALIQVESVLQVLLERRHPAYIVDLLNAALLRCRTVSERNCVWDTYH